jgi:hypothetical protein
MMGDCHHAEIESIVPSDPFNGLQGLREVVPGVDEDHLNRWVHLDGEINQKCVGHGGSQRKVRPKRVGSPLDDVVSWPALEGLVEVGQLLVGKHFRLKTQPRQGNRGVAHQTAHSDSPSSTSYGPVSS